MKKKLFVLLIVLFASHGLNAQPLLFNIENWFPFEPKNSIENGIIDLNDWLDTPAGKHGFIQNVGNKLVFEDGKKIKLWGTNICGDLPFINQENADRFVNFIGKYGVNAVRFHKFTWHAYFGNQSTELDPEKWKRFDYFQSELKEKGIYYGWSHIYGQKVLADDSSKIIAYSEIKNLKYPWGHLNGSTSGLVNFAPDLQVLSIRLTVNMLNHVNPYTGLRYADDPALAFIEFQNEDNIFWSAIEQSLKQAPTYRTLLCKQFSEWLKEKYGTQAQLIEAWGGENLPNDESLEKNNIYPAPKHEVFSWEYRTAQKESRPMARHFLDKMTFLYEAQLTFYKRFEAAVRATGYKGVLVGSCWQAGSGISHYYNLHTDYEVGMIDRHNYFGGGTGGHRLKEGEVNNGSMLQKPGSGLLSAGLQQIADRPFSFSEWMSKIPNEWTAEATALIAFYGMGLQGWDASFSFATDLPRFSRLLESESHGVYNATSPLHLGLYPALARMVYRNDVKESPILATRNVHIPSLENGNLGFEELVKQEFDDKTFTGTVPPAFLAIGRFPAQFTDTFRNTEIANHHKYWDTEAETITSVTGELNWHYGEHPYVTLNTDATKGVVGFASGEKIDLGDWQITTKNKFAFILITNLTKAGDLNNTDQILLTTVARARNTGMEYNYSGVKTILTKRGTKPLLLEPVNARIAVKGNSAFDVEILDHDGVPTGRKIPQKNGSFLIDGEKYKTIYYLITRTEE